MNKCLLLPLILLAFLACKPTSSKEIIAEPPQPTTEIQGIADSLHGKRDTTIKAPTIVEQKEVSKPHITDHICSPNITLLAKPSAGKQIFYVSGLDPQEFKCWEEILKHATSICGEENCTLYYVDMADIKVIPGAADLIDPAVLKEHGVAKFAQVKKFYNFNGASIWKRQGNGWAYYTTNNQFGG
jgi:hypothetical protein